MDPASGKAAAGTGTTAGTPKRTGSGVEMVAATSMASSASLLLPTPAMAAAPMPPPPAYGATPADARFAYQTASVNAAHGSGGGAHWAFRIPVPTFEVHARRYQRTGAAVLALAIVQMVIWFPLGFLYLWGIHGRRGRAHWRIACFFLALALWAFVALASLVPSPAIFLLHILAAVRPGTGPRAGPCARSLTAAGRAPTPPRVHGVDAQISSLVVGKDHEHLEVELALMDEDRYMQAYWPQARLD